MTSLQELRFRVGGGFVEIFPGDEDEVLVFKEFLEFLAFDEVEVVLTPLGAPVGVIEGRALDFGVVIGEMNDELIGASGKRLQHFLVSVEPFGLWNSEMHLQDAVENDGIGIEGELLETRIVREEDGKFVGFGGGEIDMNEVGRTDHGAHVGIEMGEVNTAGQSFIDLGMHFGLDVGHFGVSDDVGSGQRKIAIGIEETGAFGLSGHGGPAVTGPIGVEGKMDAEVGVGMGFGPLRDFREPRAGDEDAGGSDPMVFEGFFGGGVDAVHHAEIIRVDDEEAGIGRIPEALGEGDGVAGGLGRGLLREERSEEKGHKGKRSEGTKHGASELVW